MVSSEDESERFSANLRELRQVIIRVDPTVMYDGRFEELFVSPPATIDIARQLLETIPELRT